MNTLFYTLSSKAYRTAYGNIETTVDYSTHARFAPGTNGTRRRDAAGARALLFKFMARADSHALRSTCSAALGRCTCRREEDGGLGEGAGPRSLTLTLTLTSAACAASIGSSPPRSSSATMPGAAASSEGGL